MRIRNLEVCEIDHVGFGFVVLVISEEAVIGARVRVGESGWRSEWRGLTGTISGRWGNPDYLALDVLLEDGRTQFFWHHELEEIGTGAASPSKRR